MQAQDINFLIIGASKSATTWLQKSLQETPGVIMPDPELHYFSRFYDRGKEWYLAQFPQVHRPKLIGEKSNSYLEDPNAAHRVRSLLPHAKLIVQLRNPVERAYSDYCMLYRRGEVGGKIGDYLSPKHASFRRFIRNGLYHRLLAPYTALYPPEQMLILLYEDLIRDREAQLRRVSKFLKIEELNIRPVDEVIKDRTVPMMGPVMRRMLYPLKPLRPLTNPVRRTAVFQALRRRTVSQISYPPLTPQLRRDLEEYYQPDVASLGEFLGRDLSDWLSAPRKLSGDRWQIS